MLQLRVNRTMLLPNFKAEMVDNGMSDESDSAAQSCAGDGWYVRKSCHKADTFAADPGHENAFSLMF